MIRIVFYLGWIFLLIKPVFANIISGENDNYYILTDHYFLIISKSSGMLESARLREIDFEIAADYPGFSLFFTEFALQLPDTTGEIFSNSALKTFGGTVTHTRFQRDEYGRLTFVWENDYICTRWDYNFFRDKKYFVINLERAVKTTAVYANHQQCIMTNPDFDNSYLVNYEGEWFQVMAKGNVGPGAMERAASFQHSMYTAIDNGLGQRFPALGWYQSETDVTFGVIIPAVSANQRVSIAYHGGGRTPIPRHPGFSECQIDWFGKADSEAILLKQGTSYWMKLIYYLSPGSIDSLDNFNQVLFNEAHYDLEKCEDYSVASWGGRRAYLRQYTWTFPQASTNYINSQELFEHRAISIPRSQNGTIWPHLFDIMVTHQDQSGNRIDLTPLPRTHGDSKVHEQVVNRQGDGWHEGEVTWRVHPFENRLCYRVYNESDKLVVAGKITPLESISGGNLVVELLFSARITYVKKLTESIWDIRAVDTIYGEIGITVYDMQGIVRVEKDAFGLYLVLNDKIATYHPEQSFEYEFKLYPHREARVECAADIPPFFTKPEELYREYYLTFPELKEKRHWGIRPDRRITVVHSTYSPEKNDFFSLEFYAEKGTYPIFLYANLQEFLAVAKNGEQLNKHAWTYDLASGCLRIETEWDGLTSITLFREANSMALVQSENSNNKRATLQSTVDFQMVANYPNPFNSRTCVEVVVHRPQVVTLTIYNLLGQPVAELFNGFLGNGKHHFAWDITSEPANSFPSGIYWVSLKSTRSMCRSKLLLLK